MPDPCICVLARLASRKLTARYDVALSPTGVSLAQFSLLRSIGERGPVALGRLAEMVGLDRSTLGRNVRVLKRMELVTIRPGDDLREAMLCLTKAGEAARDRAMPLWQEAQDDVRRRLGAAGVTQLAAIVAAL